MCQIEWEEKSCAIQWQVIKHPFFLEANVIYCYVDYRNEVGTKMIIKQAWESGKKVAVPKVEGEEMNFYYISDFSDLKEGYRGILEPDVSFPANDVHALMIMPGVAFDKKRNRIGYGKGFYDKFMDKHPTFYTIALAFECQLIEEIEANSFDYCPQILITEEKRYDEHVTK
jgi:5-formyltetrahydrofolate cyclo-ligase